MTDNAEVRKLIEQAVKELNKSETGRATKQQLFKFLNGRYSSLDWSGRDAVSGLIQLYEMYAGSVLEALDDDTGKGNRG